MLEKNDNIFHREAEHFKYNHPANKQKAGKFSVEKHALDIGRSSAPYNLAKELSGTISNKIH